jgi:sulfonate transport system ATP-binding protein
MTMYEEHIMSLVLDRSYAEPASKRATQAPGQPGLSITARGLGKTFGGKQVLADVNFHIEAGQFVAVVGKSGCGKSTLLRLVLGLEAPSEGRLLVGGDSAPPDQARIMFQEPRLLPWRRVFGNVDVGLDRAVDTFSRHSQAHAALQAVGLADRAQDWPSVLSGGQKQRVALARALVSRPRLLALDEPLGALDALTRIEMQRLIETIWQEQGFTALLVTHDVGEAVALADRILVIDAGRIAHDIAIDTPRPRRRGDASLAALEDEILTHLFNDHGSGI